MFWVCLFPWMKKKKCENRMTCCADSPVVMQKHHPGKTSCKLYLKGCGNMQQSGFLPWASYQLQNNWQCLWIIAHLSSLDRFPLHSKLLVESLGLGNCSGMKENWRSVGYLKLYATGWNESPSMKGMLMQLWNTQNDINSLRPACEYTSLTSYMCWQKHVKPDPKLMAY